MKTSETTPSPAERQTADNMLQRETEPFLRRTIRHSALEPFGFQRAADGWTYEEVLPNGAFTARVRIDPNGAVFGCVIDNDLNEAYLPIRTEREVGSFVGAVREAYRSVLERIAKECFTEETFLYPQANRLAARIAAQWNEQCDHPFSKLPECAVFRCPQTRKWYGLVMPIPRSRLTKKPQAENDPIIEVLNLKIAPERADALYRVPGIFPGYHMKRPDWISIVLDDTVPDELILDLLAASRDFAMRGAKAARTGSAEWIVPANPKYYDVDAAFLREDVIDWKQSSAIRVGDTVYLYVAAPTSAVRYRCTAVEVDLPYPYRDKHVSMKRVMRIRREQTYSPDAVPFAKLCALGIRAVRGPRLVTSEFSDYMKTL